MKYKIDNLGRITIPAEFRRNLGINTGDDVKITLEDGKIVVQKNSGKNYDDLLKQNEFLMTRENKLQNIELFVNETLNKYENLLKEEQNPDVASFVIERIKILENIKERIGE